MEILILLPSILLVFLFIKRRHDSIVERRKREERMLRSLENTVAKIFVKNKKRRRR